MNRPLLSHFVRPAAQVFGPPESAFAAIARGSAPAGPTTVRGMAVRPSPGVLARLTTPATCTLPSNPKATTVGFLQPDGSTLQVTDPHFTSLAAYNAWIAAHPACPSPPAYVPDLVAPATPITQAQAVLGQTWNGLSIGAWAGIGLAVAGVVGAVALAASAPPARATGGARGSSRRTSRRTSGR